MYRLTKERQENEKKYTPFLVTFISKSNMTNDQLEKKLTLS